jgi:flagellar M-ring protein FliF
MGQIDLMTMIQTAVLALVALVLGLFVIRPVLTSANRPALAAPDAPLALPPATGDGVMALNGELDAGYDFGGFPTVGGEQIDGEVTQEDPATRLRRLIEERQTESIEILRGWMEHEEENA